MKALLLILTWTAGWGVILLGMYFLHSLIKFKVRYRVGGIKKSLGHVFIALFLLVFSSFASDVCLLGIIKNMNKNNDIVITNSSIYTFNKDELSTALNNAYSFKSTSGHHPIEDEFIELYLDGFQNIKLKLNRDSRDPNLYWISLNKILGYGSIGYVIIE